MTLAGGTQIISGNKAESNYQTLMTQLEAVNIQELAKKYEYGFVLLTFDGNESIHLPVVVPQTDGAALMFNADFKNTKFAFNKEEIEVTFKDVLIKALSTTGWRMEVPPMPAYTGHVRFKEKEVSPLPIIPGDGITQYIEVVSADKEHPIIALGFSRNKYYKLSGK